MYETCLVVKPLIEHNELGGLDLSTLTAISIEEYLESSYRPDCDYLDGVLLERNVGEWDHSRLQMLLSRFLSNREEQWGILVVPEQRVQVRANRFRVPDVLVLLAGETPKTIVTAPPFLCIEILSPSDRMTEMQDRIDDYLSFGVSYVWVIDPRTRRAFAYTANRVEEVKDGILCTEQPEIRVPLSELGS